MKYDKKYFERKVVGAYLEYDRDVDPPRPLQWLLTLACGHGAEADYTVPQPPKKAFCRGCYIQDGP